MKTSIILKTKKNSASFLFTEHFVLPVIFLILVFPGDVYSGNNLTTTLEDTASVKKADTLFSSDEPLELILLLDHKKIAREKAKEPAYTDARIIYGGADSFNIRVKTRGYSRRVYSFCTFPPLMLNFKKGAAHTIFEGQNKLKLVTYCMNSDQNENYIIEEYLIYKLYNLLTDYSFRVRLAHITYKDINNKVEPIIRYGFFIESPGNLSKRLGSSLLKTELPNQDRCDRNFLDLFTLFQYMIGNTDWAITKLHNVTLIQGPDKFPIPIPFDFDYSGVINTTYAAPSEQLPIKSVRERLFRGYCRTQGTYEKVIPVFNKKKDDIYNLYGNINIGNKRRLEDALKYYDSFYETLNDPKLLTRKIYDACEINHEHFHKMNNK